MNTDNGGLRGAPAQLAVLLVTFAGTTAVANLAGESLGQAATIGQVVFLVVLLFLLARR